MSKSDLTLERLGELLAHEKAAANASKQTLTWYTGTLRRYSEWLSSRDLAPTLANFTAELVQRYVLDLQQQPAREYHPYMLPIDKPLSDHSVNSYVRALRGFASWLYAEGYTREHILGRMRAPKTTQIVQDILSVDEIGQIAGALNPRTEIGARDQAIFLLLLDTCMRAGELCGLTLDQLHLDEGYAMVLGKGKKMRPVRIGARAAKALRFYLLHWRKPAVPAEPHVFLTCKNVQTERGIFSPRAGDALSVGALDHAIKRIGKRAGVLRLHPHLLRHTAACLHLMRHRDPFALKSLLGHTTLTMTQHYVAAVSQLEIVQADTVSIVDGLDAAALNRAPTRKPRVKAPRPIDRMRRHQTRRHHEHMSGDEKARTVFPWGESGSAAPRERTR
jgi:site-specific recombinase XerD